MATAAQIAAQRARVVSAIARVGGLEAGVLREVLDALDATPSDEFLREKGYRKISKRVQHPDLTAAAVTQTIAFDDEIPAGAIVVAASIDLAVEFAGGSIAALTVDVGDADVDRFINLTDIFTGAGAPLVESQADPGVGLDRSLAGDAIIPVAVTPDLLFTSTTDDLVAATAGDMTAHIYYTLPASA